MNKRNHWSQKLASLRKIIHPAASLTIVLGVMLFQWNLAWIAAVGAVMGLFGGKVFCRWFCPMGWIMEKMSAGAPDETARAQLAYYKLGCPIAWVSGLANKFSIFKIKNDKSACIDCGACDKACYITTLDKRKSLFRESAQDPALEYACSKCLSCVESCPTSSLTVDGPGNKN